jgi:hypothetical protein
MESERRNIEEEGRREARSAATARVTVIARIFLLAARLCDRRVVLKIINKRRWAGIGNLIWRQKQKLTARSGVRTDCPNSLYHKHPIDSHNK